MVSTNSPWRGYHHFVGVVIKVGASGKTPMIAGLKQTTLYLMNIGNCQAEFVVNVAVKYIGYDRVHRNTFQWLSKHQM